MTLSFMDIFDEWANEYDQFVEGHNLEYHDVFSNYALMLKLTANEAISPVIEFGPGTGNLTNELIHQGHEVFPIEPSDAMKVIGQEKTKMQFIKGDFLNFPQLDVRSIVSSFAFHHLTDDEKATALKKYYDLLPIGGKVIILDTIFNSEKERELIINHYTSLGYDNLVADLNREYYPQKKLMEQISKQIGFSYESKQLNTFAHLQVLTKINQSPRRLIGNTPLVELTTFDLPVGARLFAKLEMYNLGGSIKDRLGEHLIKSALENQLIRTNEVVEATAGNTGIGLALACQKYGLQLTVFLPKHFSLEKQQLMKALGATIIHTDTMLEARERAILYSRETGAYFTNQFENNENPNAYSALAKELIADVGHIDTLVVGAGSGGTFTGLARALKPFGTKTVIVEPVGSVLCGGEAHSHLTEGIGVDAWPTFLDPSLVDKIETISDEEAFKRVRQLALQEGLFVGSSSGAVLQASLNQATKGNIVVIFPDASDRYLSKNIYEEL